MSVLFDEYLRLEAQMLSLDATPEGEAEADEIRDFMDEVWRRLSPSQRQRLNERPFVAHLSRPRLSIQVGPGFIAPPVAPSPPSPAHSRQLTVSEKEIWCAA